MTDVVIVLTTVPEGDLGDTIARRLIEERVAACVNVCAPMTSLYRWRGAVERETERQLVIKTTREHVPAVQACIAELHSYELPEFIVLAVADGSTAYLDWLQGEVTCKPKSES
jgi:periplasmic divalent cation tolerance protein